VELARILTEGYALDLEEAEPGLNCVALPLRLQGRVVAALGVAAPASRLPKTALRRLATRAMGEMFDIIKL
jgi:DNA-binding IclR family transcriptional regulator